MGNHQLPRTPSPGPLKNRRTLVVITTGVTLAAGGAVGAAAVGDTDSGPQSAANSMGTPAAETAGPEQPTSTPSSQEERTPQQQNEATKIAHRSSSDSIVQQEEDAATSTEADSDLNAPGENGTCEASMYSEAQPTANGETFDPSAMTAAHKELPFNTMVEVTNPTNGASTTVRINDRGPFVEGRCLDLSKASFETIASPDQGVTDVEWRVVE